MGCGASGAKVDGPYCEEEEETHYRIFCISY